MFQQGTHGGPFGSYRWLGAMGIDRSGGIGLAYSYSGLADTPSLGYTGRLASDLLGTMGQGEALPAYGAGYQQPETRWGYWNMLSTDPLDECTFWFTGEFMGTTGSNTWRTEIVNFALPGCSPANDPPFVAITSPASGAYIEGTVAVQANATDDIAVASVTFLRNGVAFGTDTIEPYSRSWDTTTVPEGAYTLSARARDSSGQLTTSAPVNVTVDNPGGVDLTPPAVVIGNPDNGETLAGVAKVAAKATDAVGVTRVDFYQGGVLIGSATAPPWAIDWNTTTVADDYYSLTARGFDAAGNVGVSEPVVARVHNTIVTTAILKNGGFESNLSHWTQVGPVARDTSLHKLGVASARIGSTSAFTGDASIGQTFTVPFDGTTTLRFWYQLRCDFDRVEFDQQEVLFTGVNVNVSLLRTCDTNTTWQQAVFDLTPWAGQTLTLTFRVHDDGYAYDPTWMYIDAVSVKNVY